MAALRFLGQLIAMLGGAIMLGMGAVTLFSLEMAFYGWAGWLGVALGTLFFPATVLLVPLYMGFVGGDWALGGFYLAWGCGLVLTLVGPNHECLNGEGRDLTITRSGQTP